MTAVQRQELWAGLVRSGIVTGDLPDDARDASPWYVRAMVCVAAWIAALFLLVSVGVGLVELMKSPVATAIAGLVICAAAIVLMRANPAGIFATQLALAASLAGQSLVAYALLQNADRLEVAPWLWLSAFEVALVVVAPNHLHRVLATLAAATALYVVMVMLGWGALFPALAAAAFVMVQGNEARLAPRTSLWQPVATGLAFAALAAAGGAMFGASEFAFWGNHRVNQLPPWTGIATVAVVWLATVGQLLRNANAPVASRLALWSWLAALALVAAAWPIPGLAVTLIVMLIAFAAGNVVIVGLAILAMLAALGHYYYSLQTTLLVKSGALLATGVVLLLSRYFLRSPANPAKEPGHA